MPSPSGGGRKGARRRWYQRGWHHVILSLLVLLSGLVWSARGDSKGDWSECPSVCRCKFSAGRKLAECSSAGFTAIPGVLHTEIQNLDLTNNKFHTLPKDAFKQVGLVNLQKLYLKDCGIEVLNKDAFRGLVILIELDLSQNMITTLHATTFLDTYKLRVLHMNANRLTKLDNGLFSNHSHLQTVSFNGNSIEHVGPKTFSNLPALLRIHLDGNQLSYLKLDTVAQLSKLASLDLSNNPWRCDCRLRPLRDWVVQRKLYTQPTSCAEPQRLKEKHWIDIPSEDFACRPQLVLPSVSVAVSPGMNVTLSCRAAGDPTPVVQWILNSLVLNNSTRGGGRGHRQHYLVRRGESRNHLGEYWTWTNLTILDVKHYDAGKYACGAKNPGGIAEEILTLGVREGAGGGFIMTSGNNDLWTYLVALVIAACVLLICVLLLCFCLCRRKGRRNRNSAITKKHDTQLTSNGDLNITGEDEQEKALITKINPLQKPPRRIESAQSSLNGSQGADIGRLGLMDGVGNNQGNHGGGNAVRTRGSEGSGDHSESDDLLIGRSYDSLGSDPPHHHHHHPNVLPAVAASTLTRQGTLPREMTQGGGVATRPDLLAFPPRGPGHDSPAGSSTSTAPDSSRLIMMPGGPQSPIMLLPPHSAGFGTLPYNRSHSPFSPTMAAQMMGSCGSLPIVTSRQGYVTIPRRPRAPSWAAPPRPGDPLLKLDPIYDNLGPRTTADGSSVLSLNKSGGEATGTLTRTPNHRGSGGSNNNRPLPSLPQPHFITPLPQYYAPIEEVPSPAPTRHKMANNNNQEEPSRNSLSPRATPSPPSPSPTTPLQGSSPKRRESPTKYRASPVTIASPIDNNNSRRSTSASPVTVAAKPPKPSPNKKPSPPSTTEPTNEVRKVSSPTAKVPPKVPPKPKKKPQLANGGSVETANAVYEDEGEDGTEV